jgi:hypothetical protein
MTTTTATSVACFHGHTWCVRGNTEHCECEGPTLGLPVSNRTGGTVQILQVRRSDFSRDADTVEMSFFTDRIAGFELTSAELRDLIARCRTHLDRLAEFADQYDALVGGGQ